MSARQESGPLTPPRVGAAFPTITRGTSRNRPGTVEAEDGRLRERPLRLSLISLAPALAPDGGNTLDRGRVGDLHPTRCARVVSLT
jgi:hypothetical protein